MKKWNRFLEQPSDYSFWTLMNFRILLSYDWQYFQFPPDHRSAIQVLRMLPPPLPTLTSRPKWPPPHRVLAFKEENDEKVDGEEGEEGLLRKET